MSILSSRWRRATLAGIIAALGLALGAGAAQAATESVQLYLSASPSSLGGNSASAGAPNTNTVTITNLMSHETKSGTGYVNLTGAPMIGDVIEVDYKTAVFKRTFDGKPSVDSTVCAGKNAVSGTFAPGVPTTAAYDIPTAYAKYQQTTPTNNLANNTYSGSFQNPIGSGDYVVIEGFVQSAATSGNVNLQLDETSAMFPPNCPPAPKPTPTPPAPPMPAPPIGSLTHGGVFQLGSFDRLHGLADLFHGGLLFGFVVDDPTPGPDSLTLNLVSANTTPPAQAAGKKKHTKHKAKKTKILARGAVTVTAPGTVTVKVLPTAYGRKFLKHKKKQTVTVVDTLKNTKTGVSKTLTFQLALQK